MSRKIIVPNDVRHLLFGEIYQRYSEPKARRRAFGILETALTCFDRKGFKNTSFKMIAREAGLTPPSLRYYFSDLEEIRDLALQYTHVLSQKIVIEHMSKSSDPEGMLRGYLQGHAIWASHFQGHFRVWLEFLSDSSKRKKDRLMNSAAIANGTNRICEMLAQGRQAGVFRHKDDFFQARFLQALILGWLTALVTEEIEDPASYSKKMIDQCLRVLVCTDS